MQGLYTVQHASLRLGQVVIRYATGLAGAQMLMRRPEASLSALVRMPYHSESPFSLGRESSPD